jgi:hypothetical protein
MRLSVISGFESADAQDQCRETGTAAGLIRNQFSFEVWWLRRQDQVEYLSTG